ncbi:gamma-glutamyl-peptidase activity protein [Paramecium bursaria]
MEPKWFKIDEITCGQLNLAVEGYQVFLCFMEFKGYEAIINNTLQVVDQEQLREFSNGLIIQTTDDAKQCTQDASYVKYVESGGAIVIPILWDASYDELNYILGTLMVFQSQGEIRQFILTKHKLDSTLTNLPIQSLLSLQVMQFNLIKSEMFSQYLVFKLCCFFVRTSFRTCRGPSKIETLNIKPLGTSLQYYFDITIGQYQKYTLLDRFFDMTSYSYDEVEKEYLASIQANEYPFDTVQFHPEKNKFELIPLQSIIKCQFNWDIYKISEFQILFILNNATRTDLKEQKQAQKASQLDETLQYRTQKLN